MAKRSDSRLSRVYLAKTRMEADLAVAWLEERGIPARVENPLTEELLSVLEPILNQEEGIGVLVASDRAEAAAAAMGEFLEKRPLDDEDEPEDDGTGDE